MVLLAKYKTLDPNAVNSDWTDLQKGQYEYEILDAEMLLAQTPVIAGLSVQDLPHSGTGSNPEIRHRTAG